MKKHISCEFVDIIQSNAISFIGLSKNNENKKPWATYNTIKLCRLTRKIYKKWKKTGKYHYLKTYQRIRAERNKLCRQAKKEYFDKLALKLDKYDHIWWKTVNNLRSFQHNNKNKIPLLQQPQEEKINQNNNNNNKNQYIFDNQAKANLFNLLYCHPGKKLEDLNYQPKFDISLKNITNSPLLQSKTSKNNI